MSQPNKRDELNNEGGEIRYDFEDFDVTFAHDDASNEDFAEVIIEGRGARRGTQGEYLENVVLASGVQALQSERFREKTRSVRAAEKAMKELEQQSLEMLKHSEPQLQSDAADSERDKSEAAEEADEQKQAIDTKSAKAGVAVSEDNSQTVSTAEKKPFAIDERDENSDKRRHHYPKKHSHSNIARKWRKMKKWQKGIIIFLLALLALIIAAVITVYSMHHSGQKAMMEGNYADNFEDIITVDGVEYMYNTDITSIAFFGVDRRTFGLKDDLVGTAGQSDVNMVVAVNTKTGLTNVIVVPRDTLVDVDKYSLEGDYMGTEKQQLCLAYAYGDGANTSCDNSVTSLQRVLYGIPINTYVALNLDGIQALNDRLGGVRVVCPNDFDNYKKGEEIVLSGEEAEHFIRTREHSNTGDIARRDRQIAYVKAFVSQAAKVGLKNPSALTDFYNVGKEYTVTNLTLSRSLYFGTTIMSNAAEVMSFDNIVALKGKVQDDSAGYAQVILDEESTLQSILDIYYTALK